LRGWAVLLVPPGRRPRRAPPLRHVQQNRMPRRQGKNIFHQRHRLGDGAKEQIGGQRIRRKSFCHASREQRAHLGGEKNSLRCLRVIERPDTQRIAREKQERRLCKTSSQIEHGKGKHAAQFLGTLFFPFFPSVR